MLRRGLVLSLSATATSVSRLPNFHGRWRRKRLRTLSMSTASKADKRCGKASRDLERRLHSGLRFSTEPDRDVFFARDLNETPNRTDTLRMRSGVRSMMRAASSSDFFALASSTTRRSSAKDQDLGSRRALLNREAVKRRSADGFAARP